jgi:hypothetical protein
MLGILWSGLQRALSDTAAALLVSFKRLFCCTLEEGRHKEMLLLTFQAAVQGSCIYTWRVSLIGAKAGEPDNCKASGS